LEGGLNVRKCIAMTSCSKPTATRDLAELVERGVLLTTGAGRAIRYALNLDAFPSKSSGSLFGN
jgi:Fic family protein